MFSPTHPSFRFVAALIVFLASASARAAELATATFAHPPPAFAPRTWWHWLDGNISREGITQDLEALRAAGNVHAIYAIVTERIGANSIGIRLNHYQQMGFDFAQPGDVLAFCVRETLLDYGERTVKRVERVNEEYSIIEFTQPLDGFLQAEISSAGRRARHRQ